MKYEELLKNEGKLSKADKEELMRAVASDEGALSVYIKTRAAVLEPLIRKENQIRMILRAENIGNKQPYYPIGSREVQTVWLSGGLGSAPRRQIEGDETYVPIFSIHGRVEWSLDLAADARFPLIEETNFYLAEQLKEAENYIGWNLIKAVADHAEFPANNTVQIESGSGVDLATGQGYFSKQLLGALQLAADTSRRRITDVFMSPRSMFDMWTYWSNMYAVGGTDSGVTAIPSLPPGAAESIFNAGTPNSGDSDAPYSMTMFGIRFHKVYDTNIVDNEHVYAFDLSGSRSQFGVMPIRQGVQTFQDPIAITEYKAGYFARERFGMAVLDPTNMFVGIIDR